MIAGGFAAFNSGCPSDRRYLWFDVSYTDAFGYASPPLMPPSARRLKTKDPNMVARYNSQLRQKLENESLLNDLEKIHQHASVSGWSHALENEYNRINDRQYTIRQQIERKIRHLRMGALPWSPKLQSFRDKILVWSLLLKKRKSRKVSNRKIRRLLLKTDTHDAYTKSLSEIEALLDASFLAYKKAREQAVRWRDEFMESLASSRSLAKGTEKEVELKQLRAIEKQRTVARNIKRMQGKLQRNATTQIFVNRPDGRHIITDKDEMEDACIEENESRFSQCEDTPPMIEPLVSDLGYLADTPEAEAILNGTYQAPTGTDPYARLLLEELKMPDNVINNPMLQTDVTPEANKRAWAKQKEVVSSEPNGLTFSHYKAGAQDPVINEFDAMLRNLPYKYGFSPSHWQEITDIAILKKAGVYDVEKMRTITLMDAAFNMNNKQLGRDLLIHAEALKNLPREQYGSQKNHRSSTAAANKVLTMDLLRMRRQAGALCSNDAKSCYDRISHSMQALAFIRQGAPRPAVMSLLKTLQRAQHKIRTAYGDSTKHYGKDRNPPTGFSVLSTPIINMMRKAGFGLQIAMCLSSVLISFLCYAFVDDTDLIHTGPSVVTTGEFVLHDMRHQGINQCNGPLFNH